jgi:DNA-binding SARP family transcriptional activator
MNPDRLDGPAAKPPTFRVLGPLSVWDGECYQPLPASKPVSMLAALLTSPNEVTSHDFLVRAVWGDEAEVDARSALRTCTTRLRKLLVRHNLGDDLIQTVSGGFRLRAGTSELDLLLFRDRVVAATRLDGVDDQVGALRGALGLWEGSLLCNVGSDVLHRGIVPLLEEERLQVLERIVELLVRDGRDAEALAELQQLTRSHEGHERFALQLVGVLHRAGRREDALAECARMKQYLADELGLDPTPELAAAEMAILTGDLPVAETTEPERPEEPTAPTAPPATPVALAPAAAPALAAQSLLGISGFVGRAGELDRLVERLAAPDGVRTLCLLVGPPGVGKTALAVHAAARAAVRSPLVADQVLVRMRDEDDEPRDLAALLDEVAERTSARAGGLLLLDDAHHERDVAAIADAHPRRSLLVTTGTPMLRLVRTHGALVHRVGELRPGDAFALLGHLLGTTAVADDVLAAHDIVTRCWRNPLALRALAATLQTRPAWDLATAATWLADDPVDRLSAGLGELSLTAYVDRALDRLDPPLPAVVRALARLAERGFDLADAGAAVGPSYAEVVHLHLQDLVARGWVEELAPGTFRVDPFVRAFAHPARPRRPAAPAPALSVTPLHRPSPIRPTTSTTPTPQMPQEGAR